MRVGGCRVRVVRFGLFGFGFVSGLLGLGLGLGFGLGFGLIIE